MAHLYIFHHVFKTGGTSFNLSYLPAEFEIIRYLAFRRGSIAREGPEC
jgi:hypothetical protein